MSSNSASSRSKELEAANWKPNYNALYAYAEANKTCKMSARLTDGRINPVYRWYRKQILSLEGKLVTEKAKVVKVMSEEQVRLFHVLVLNGWLDNYDDWRQEYKDYVK